MENIKIPPKLEKKLSEDSSSQECVLSSLNQFYSWLERNTVIFFPEYTDHSLKHVEGVLETADRLILDECRDIVTHGDVATLIVAALLHDCAMHLSVDGFKTLIKSDKIIDGFGDDPWSKLWEDFIAEARHFDGRKLKTLFGDDKAINPPPSNPDDLNSHELTKNDLLLIGEFLRKHHHRLAHEISQYGVPGPKGFELKLPGKDETEHIIDFAGLVARSHGLPIRSCFDYLKAKYNSVIIYKDVHPVYLMGLLRVSDILQLQSKRAPKQVGKVQELRSPVSKNEWEMNQAIKYINWIESPETILVHAKPQNARTFIKIKKILNQIQEELDSSWTVIGEVFHSNENLSKLGFTKRRICSNLDDVKTYAREVSYIPCHAAFEVADTDLLKLLIGPLYGERPEIGIRELMQNSIDAVLERREYLEKHPELKHVEFTGQEADVVVSIDKEEDGWWVTVSDRGIGMTLDTLRNYFLKAGASLRRSEIWRKTFEDEEGKSQVLRSGRFGVGVLAAFLLGNEIHVSTRHIDEKSENGIEFDAELDADSIELLRKDRPVGTTIRVRISAEVKDVLLGKCDWYCLSDPKVLLMTDHGNKKISQRYHLPSKNSELPLGYRRISHPDYNDIHWTYQRDLPYLICNGIKIVEERYPRRYLLENGFFKLNNPNISVFDYNANLPLNLQRTGLTQEKYPFHEELLSDVLKDFIAYALVNAPSHPSAKEWLFEYNYPGFKDDSYELDSALLEDLSPWFFNEQGTFFLFGPWLASRIDAGSALFVGYYKNNIYIPIFIPKKSNYFFFSELFFPYTNFEKLESLNKSIDNALDHCDAGLSFETQMPSNIFNPGKRVLISRHVIKFIEDMSKIEENHFPSYKYRSGITEWQDENWALIRNGDCPHAEFDFKTFANENDGKDYDKWPCILAEWYFNGEKPEIELSPVAKMWQEVVGSPYIPFDLEERRKMKVYKELKSYIEAQEELKKMREKQ